MFGIVGHMLAALDRKLAPLQGGPQNGQMAANGWVKSDLTLTSFVEYVMTNKECLTNSIYVRGGGLEGPPLIFCWCPPSLMYSLIT